MIPESVTNKVIRLWHELELAPTAISKKMKIPLETVRKILAGYKLEQTRKRLADSESEDINGEFPGFESFDANVKTPAARCPGCGYAVQAPCLFCWLAKRKTRPSAYALLDMGDACEYMSHDLHGEDLERYLELKRQHEMAFLCGYEEFE